MAIAHCKFSANYAKNTYFYKFFKICEKSLCIPINCSNFVATLEYCGSSGGKTLKIHTPGSFVEDVTARLLCNERMVLCLLRV